MNRYSNIKLSQLDQKVKSLSNIDLPRKGWINKVRTSLDISYAYLAKKLNSSPQLVNIFENNEVDGTITLNTLKKVAEALDCNLVYAFVPKDKSFEKLVENKADKIADYIISRTSNSMNLEMQKLSKPEILRQKKQMKNDILQNNLKNLWKYDI